MIWDTTSYQKAETPMANKELKLAAMHTHMLLWNLRAMENSARHAPVRVRAEYETTRDQQAPQYRAELAKRGVECPDPTDEGGWQIALAKALGHERPQPRKVGISAPNGGFSEVVEVWSDERRQYERSAG
jgi:hypothetical protein